ncbi:MAG: nucleotidyltransferase family protein [Ruminococcus sp.]|nr:nucleotidyltransferase family protein [Candidatus Apopatosoma intestinale]
MKCLILAAGYATRLYPLTENYPKPLLEVGGKPIIDWLIDDLRTADKIDEFVVISNHKFAHCFDDWAKGKDYHVTIVDDGTSTNETRLGAVCDIQYAIEKLHIDDDMMVLAGDNVLDFSLTKFLDFCLDKKACCVMRYFEPKKETLPKRGVLELDGDRVVSMEEKPQNPKTQWCCPPFYFYTNEDAKKLGDAIADGCGVDAPGSFIAWLCGKSPVYAMEMPGSRYDVGNLESYEKIKNEYRGITKC